MKKASRMASSLTSLLFGLTLATVGPVQADYAIKDGNANPQTISAFGCGTGGTKICPGYVPMDFTGAAFGVAVNPFFVIASDNNVPLASMTALNAATAVSLTGKHSAAVVLTGTWVGTLTPQVSVDGTNWVNTTFYNPTTHATAATVTANGTYDILGTGGKTQARVILTAYTSGTVTGNLVASSQAPSSNDAQAQLNTIAASPIADCTATPCTNRIGAVSQNGVWTVQPGNTANTAPWLFGLNTAPSLANGNGVVPTQGGAVLAASNPIFSAIANSGNVAAVKAASTPAVAADPAVVMQLNPSSPGIVTLGQALKAASVPVVIASDQTPPVTPVPNLDTAALITHSAASAGVNSADQTNSSGRGINVVVNITAITGTTPSLTVILQGKDAASGVYYNILTSSALNAVGTTVLTAFPGATTAANVAANAMLPKTWRVISTIAGTSPAVTATVGASVIE